MIVNYPKSLDRPIDIFGLKGKWIILFLVCVGAGLFLAFIVGVILGSSYGIAMFLIAAVASFFGCVSYQGKVPARQIPKVVASSKIYKYVYRKETLSNILLPENRIGSLGFRSFDDYGKEVESRRRKASAAAPKDSPVTEQPSDENEDKSEI